jgi:hypothetical protein
LIAIQYKISPANKVCKQKKERKIMQITKEIVRQKLPEIEDCGKICNLSQFLLNSWYESQPKRAMLAKQPKVASKQSLHYE